MKPKTYLIFLFWTAFMIACTSENTTPNMIRNCNQDSDCIGVRIIDSQADCCSCAYSDIINKKYLEKWQAEHPDDGHCKEIYCEICADSPATPKCINNLCQ